MSARSNHDLRRRASHQRRGRRASKVDAMGGILNRHGCYQHHPGEYRLPSVAIAERAKMDRKGRTYNQESYFQTEDDLQRRELASQQGRTQESYCDHHQAEYRKRKQLCDSA